MICIRMMSMVQRRALVRGLGAATLLALVPASAFAQADPMIGTWRLNVAKSSYNPGPPPRSGTVTIEAAGQELKGVNETVDAQGLGPQLQFTITYDGQPHPATGSPQVDATATRRIDASTLQFVGTKGGTVVVTQMLALSPDGRVANVMSAGLGPNGAQMVNVETWEKQ